MATNEFSARVRVLLSPDEATKHDTWPCREADVRFLKEDGTVVHDSLPTNDEGVIESVTLEPGTTYQVEVTSPGFEFWRAGGLTVERAGRGLRNVWLTPDPGYCFFVLRLVTSRSEPVAGGCVQVTAERPEFSQTFTANSQGYVYAEAPPVSVTLEFETEDVSGERFCPRDFLVPYTVRAVTDVDAIEFNYWPAIEIVAAPTVTKPGTKATPLYGTAVTVEYRVSAQSVATSRTKTLTRPIDPTTPPVVGFAYPYPGEFMVTLTPPPIWADLPIEAEPAPARTARTLPPGSWQTLSPGPPWEVPAGFTVVPTDDVTILVTTPDNQQLSSDPQFTISYGSASSTFPVEARTKMGTAMVPKGIPSEISLVAGTATIENAVWGSGQTYAAPLKMSDPGQTVVAGPNTVALEYEYPLTINARDDHDQPVSGAMVHIFDSHNNHIGEGITGPDGSVVIGVGGRGTYYASPHSVGGPSAILESATVNSPGTVTVRIKGPAGEALTDLSAYPVLTEEVSTIGPPAPIAGGPGGGTGAGYGQTVDQAMRDVLGWRPGGDVAGFQAALTGAFQLREVEGHTQWAWQQRGYAVQADMGALTGAQASIYARAKAALDQIQPLLAGLTALNPAMYEPQDLETIRSVVGTELQELVNELALEGGPRIQRVDELFSLLLGEGRNSRSMNPDVVQGNLGTLRQRFALTVDEIQTVDEERIVTNFRIIVEQVLALHASWSFDRDLLSGVSSKTALGTILIWLSRGLEAVCESVSDLMFALDSVYVDAAQRQVIELRFAHLQVRGVPEVPFRGNPPKTMSRRLGREAPMFLSDLLDWVLRVSRDEGPRIIQDAGKDGVLAFKPILDTLRILVRATIQISREADMPAGMQTPRVDRAIRVLADQLDEAANLATLVRVEAPPSIAFASLVDPDDRSARVDSTALQTIYRIEVDMTGSNFRGPATAILAAEGSEDLPDLQADVKINTRSRASAIFKNPARDLDNAGTTWVVSIINNDETQSVPIEVLRIPADAQGQLS